MQSWCRVPGLQRLRPSELTNQGRLGLLGAVLLGFGFTRKPETFTGTRSCWFETCQRGCYYSESHPTSLFDPVWPQEDFFLCELKDARSCSNNLHKAAKQTLEPLIRHQFILFDLTTLILHLQTLCGFKLIILCSMRWISELKMACGFANVGQHQFPW